MQQRCSFTQIQKISNSNLIRLVSVNSSKGFERYSVYRKDNFLSECRLWGTVEEICERNKLRPVSLQYILAEFDMWLLRLIIFMDFHEDKFDDNFIDHYLNVLNIIFQIDIDNKGLIDHVYYPFVKEYMYPLIQKVVNVNTVHYCVKT